MIKAFELLLPDDDAPIFSDLKIEPMPQALMAEFKSIGRLPQTAKDMWMATVPYKEKGHDYVVFLSSPTEPDRQQVMYELWIKHNHPTQDPPSKG